MDVIVNAYICLIPKPIILNFQTMNTETDKDKQIKRLKRTNRILIVYVVLSLIVMLYNAFA